MSRSSKLAELRALRASGKTRLTTYQVEEEQNIYDEVDEDGYKKRVRERLDQDDFVVDDKGEGYADDGREEWDNERRYDSASASEDEVPLKGNAGELLHPTCNVSMNAKCPVTDNFVQQNVNGKKIKRRLNERITILTNISAMDPLQRPQNQRYASHHIAHIATTNEPCSLLQQLKMLPSWPISWEKWMSMSLRDGHSNPSNLRLDEKPAYFPLLSHERTKFRCPSRTTPVMLVT